MLALAGGAGAATGSARCSSPTASSTSCRRAKGRRHALRLIRDLLAFAAERRGTNLVQAIHYASQRARAIAAWWSCSPIFWPKAGNARCASSRSRHEVIAITVDDPRELEPPEAGWVDIDDAENGRRALVNTGSAAAREALGRRRAARRRPQRAERLRGAGVEHIALDLGQRLRRWCCGGPSRGASRRRGRDAPVMLALLLLLQAGVPTVGDTVWIERVVGPVGDRRGAAAALVPRPLGQQLGPARVAARVATVRWFATRW